MKKYTYLGIAIFFVVLSLITFTRFSNLQSIKSIEINQIKDINFNNSENMLLDVRTSNEFKEGHIPLAMNVDVMKPDFNDIIASKNKEANYYVYCKSGTRSLKAYAKMRNLGFKNITNLDGGIFAYKGQVIK